MEFERAKLDVQGSVGIVTLNHPEVMNAVSPEMLGGLMKAFDEVENPKRGVRCLVMTGEGRGFCAGANLQRRRRFEWIFRRRPRARNALPSILATNSQSSD